MVRGKVYPKYAYPREVVLGVAWAILLRRRRDFRIDAWTCIAALKPPLSVLGGEYIPQHGPCLVVMNHYWRPGFQAWWSAMGISSLLAMPHAWILSSGWTAPGKWYEPVKEAASRMLFLRLAHIYGFLSMPPMPPRPKDVMKRAASVRAALKYVERTPNAVLCLAPEGHDMPAGRLGWPPAGVGRFVSLLAQRGLPIAPVGVWEAEGALTVRFGPAFRMEPAGAGREKCDQEAAWIVMRSIACLLPESLRGEFA
ncbi:MAG: hypothetical protein ACM3QS_08305 [Bacteroidota bacterium]